MKIGLDDAHAEMILGKIYIENGHQPALARWWLMRAEGIAERAGNKVNQADIKMVLALWHQKFGTRPDEKSTLIQALRQFRTLRQFDCKQKEMYMARKFPEMWHEVLTTVNTER